MAPFNWSYVTSRATSQEPVMAQEGSFCKACVMEVSDGVPPSQSVLLLWSRSLR